MWATTAAIPAPEVPAEERSRNSTSAMRRPCRIGQTLGASAAAVESAQARVVKETAEFENVHARRSGFSNLSNGVYAAAKADTARATQESARAVLTASQADLAKAWEELGPKGADNLQLKEALARLERARLNLLYLGRFGPERPVIHPSRGSALSSEGMSISLPKCLDGRSARMLCAVALRPLLSVGDRGHIDGSATEARCLIADIEQRCRGPIVW
jgi:hypothetical protein